MEGTQETRGLLRRMMRNNNLAIVKTVPAETPSQAVFQWAEESGVARRNALELLERLRQTLPFEEDGCLKGLAILDALDRQVDLMRDGDWSSANRLRFFCEGLRDQFTRLGLL